MIGGLIRDVARSAETRPVLIFGNTLSHLAPVFHRLLGERLRLLHLHRDPVVTAASIYVKTRPEWWRHVGGFQGDPYGLRITPFDPHARFFEYRDRWSSLSLFEIILYQWLERQAFAREAHARLPETPFLSLRSEDLFADPEAAVASLAEFVELDPAGLRGLPRARRNASWARSLERNPLGEAWRTYESHPEVLELARELGHAMEPAWLEREMDRYQLPMGVLPWLRHRIRYWDRRDQAARWLRERGIVPRGATDRAGLPPRSLRDAMRDTLIPHRR